jgi:hypothetical protein
MRFWKQWWWVVSVALVAGAMCAYATREKRLALKELSFKLQEMEKQRAIAMQENEELHLQIESESDPAWIEMVLMRDLGLVPEGWLKVHFKQ